VNRCRACLIIAELPWLSVPAVAAHVSCEVAATVIDGMRPPKVKFAADSLVEGDGFEPSVESDKMLLISRLTFC
jgi:hypothetical protein